MVTLCTVEMCFRILEENYRNVSDTEDDDLKYYISESHRIVSLGLTKKKQKELGLNQE